MVMEDSASHAIAGHISSNQPPSKLCGLLFKLCTKQVTKLAGGIILKEGTLILGPTTMTNGYPPKDHVSTNGMQWMVSLPEDHHLLIFLLDLRNKEQRRI